MLEFLHIKNLALIEEMSLEFSRGINVLTGETGAGKSFIIKALNFVLGEKLPLSIIRKNAEKALVEAQFSLENEELILRREINKNGRSRIYINDELSSQERLKSYKDRLLSHTSQHAQQNLLNPSFQAGLLENSLKNHEYTLQKNQLINNFKQLDQKLEVLLLEQYKLKEKREFLELQLAEIDKINPKEGEEEKLENLRLQIKENEETRKLAQRLTNLLYGESTPGFLKQLHELEEILERFETGEDSSESMEILESCRSIAISLEKKLKDTDYYQSRTNVDAIEERLFAFAQLKRKLRRTYQEILEYRKEIIDSLSFLDSSALDISHLRKEKDKIAEELKDVIKRLTPLQYKAAKNLTDNLEMQLKELGFPKTVKVIPHFTQLEILPGINDIKGQLLWEPNPGQSPLPLNKIASGGELSRFLLALETLKTGHPDIVYIFDEVDTGVGGLTLNKVAEKLQKLGQNRQIILITHWPQLAARANQHFYISKSIRNGQTYTECKLLFDAEIKNELERMAGGKENQQLWSSTPV